MKKRISFKVWVSVVFGGIWQAIRDIFSWKNKTPFWRVVWATITVCILAVTGMLGYAFYDEFVRRESFSYAWEEKYDPKLSDNLRFRNNGRDEGNSYIYDVHTKKKLMKGIDWIARSTDGDSLIVVAKNGKRGYVNRYTGKTAIPFKYDAAWIFSDGIASVCEGDSVFFIDHSGRPINGRKFARAEDYDDYIYHGELAAIPENGKYGLIDKKGNWVIAPALDDLMLGFNNMWYAKADGRLGVIATDGRIVIPMEYENVWIHSENGVTVARDDHSQSRYDYEGNLLDEFVFDEIYHMSYYIKEYDENGEQKQAVDDMLKYSASNYFGLMTKDGIPVTPPLYSHIDAVCPGVYECKIPATGDCILINAKGEKIKS